MITEYYMNRIYHVYLLMFPHCNVAVFKLYIRSNVFTLYYYFVFGMKGLIQPWQKVLKREIR